ncbi:peptidylprolyl isomerase [Endothiovibrio diazotrophicus]
MKLRTVIAALALTGMSAAVVAGDVATVNGKGIDQKALDALMAEQKGKNVSKEQAVNALVIEELLLQEAKKEKLEKRAEVKDALERQRRTYLANLVVQEHLKKNPVSDEEVKQAYDKFVGGESHTEYKARHILVKEESEAKALIKELDGGADFAELAKKKSTGPTGKNGGDLGWFEPKTMVKPFSDAVKDMKKGTYTKEPVKTQFGWHVIKLEDTRQKEPPSLDQMRGRITMFLRNQKMQEYMAKLREEAKVEIK